MGISAAVFSLLLRGVLAQTERGLTTNHYGGFVKKRTNSTYYLTFHFQSYLILCFFIDVWRIVTFGLTFSSSQLTAVQLCLTDRYH